MITKAMLEVSLKPTEKGILTLAEAQARFDQGNPNVLTIGTVGYEPNSYFFTDKYTFGIDVLPASFVPSCTTLPLHVTPRPGLEDGVVDTLEKLIMVFNYDEQRIENMEDLVELLNRPTTDSIPQQHVEVPKFQPEHFPRGTVCTVKVIGQPARTLVVDCVACNGWGSYVLVTGNRDAHGLPDNFNISWVISIEQRGSGGMQWEQSNARPLFHSKPLQQARTGYVVYHLHSLVEHLLRNESPGSRTFDADRLTTVLSKQSFVKKRSVTASIKPYMPSINYFVLNKKKTKRWFQQNKNRFLVSKKTQEKLRAEYERSMDY